MKSAQQELSEFISSLPLIDHHMHGPLRTTLDEADLIDRFTESDRPAAAGTHRFDSQIGFAVRAHCAPLLNLPRHVSAERYFRMRNDYSPEQLVEVFMGGDGIRRYLNDTGLSDDITFDSGEITRMTGVPVDEVVRIEKEFELFADSVDSPEELVDGFATHLQDRTRAAVGLKSIIAYRYGFDFDPAKPPRGDVLRRAQTWLGERRAHGASLQNIDLLRWALWAGIESGLPIQLHSGYGDPDVDLHRCNPLLLTDLIRLVEPLGTKILLLHNYPFHREAGFLAHSFPSVYFDVGLATHYTGPQSDAIIRETFELAPFGKMLFSSDAWGPPELHFLGTSLWRRGVARVISDWVDSDEWSLADGKRVAEMVGATNATRVYGLTP